MEPGIYYFKTDTANPCGDKRVSREFARLPVWKKGFRVAVQKDWEMGGVIRIFALGGYSFGGFRLVNGKLRSAYTDDAKLEAATPVLLAALVPEPDSLDVVHYVETVSYEEMIEALLKVGKVTLEDIRNAVRSEKL